MKHHMHNWGVFASVMGTLSIIIGVLACLMTMSLSVGIGAMVSGISLFVFRSVCNWMDDVLDALNGWKERSQNVANETAEKVTDEANAQ